MVTCLSPFSCPYRIQWLACFQPAMIRKMPGSGIMCTASWLCGVWGWPIGRMQTGMRIRQRPMNWSRYSIKIQRALELGGGGRKCSPQELRQICFASHSFFTLLKLHSIKLSCIVRSFFFFLQWKHETCWFRGRGHSLFCYSGKSYPQIFAKICNPFSK